MEYVNIKIPIEGNALKRAANMLMGMREDLTGRVEAMSRAGIKETHEVGDPHLFRSHPLSNAFSPEQMGDDAWPDTPKVREETTEEIDKLVSAGVLSVADGVRRRIERIEEIQPQKTPEEIFGGTPPPPATVTALVNTEPKAPGVPGVETDSEGLPWDGRIHSSSRSFLSKGGGWKKKRGVDPVIVAEVEAELREVMSIPTTSETLPAPVSDMPPAPVSDMPPAPISETLPATEMTFVDFMSAVTAAGIPAQQVMDACVANGVKFPALLVSRPDLIPAVAAALGLE